MAEQAQEKHARELEKQRDHERMVAQIARTDRTVDDFCDPVALKLATYKQMRYRFVTSCATELETSQPQAFAELYAREGYAMKNGLELAADGTLRWAWVDVVMLDTMAQQGHTWTATNMYLSFYTGSSARSVDVALSDAVAFAKPYLRELPQAFLDLMAADVDGSLATNYRGYIRHDVKPILDQITAIVHAHHAVIDPPPVEWLLESFPAHSKIDTPSNIVAGFVAYTQAWTRVLAEWDAGRLGLLHPPSHMMPLSVLVKYVEYSSHLGKAKRK